MSQTTATIVAVVISSGVSLAISILTIISQNRKTQSEMHESIAVIKSEMNGMKEDIKSHNQYAQMFSENVPAIRQHMTDIDRRLDAMERKGA